MVTQNILSTVFWGKLGRNLHDQPVTYLPLKYHCLDVAIVFRHLVELPAFQSRLNSAAETELLPAQLDRLAVFALLHDFGKANLGFQDKPFDLKALRAGHIFESAPLFFETGLSEQFARVLNIEQLLSWFETEETFTALCMAILSHHGRPIPLQDLERHKHYNIAKKRWWTRDGKRDPFQAIAELMELARRAFPKAFDSGIPRLPDAPRLQHRFAGMLMLADWLGSHDAFFPIDNGEADRLQMAPSAAKQAISAVGLNPRPWQDALASKPWRFSDYFGGYQPYPLQHSLDQLATNDPDHRLLIAEAETGSGKTEAAVARFFRLFAAGRVDGLYFALPTRVAARELYQRVLSYVEVAFPDPANRPMVLLAVPGYARVDGLETKLLPDSETRWTDDTTQRFRERCWASEHPKRFLAATIAVGTIDQALLSALQTPHAHLRSVCLDRQFLVVDEVHASDPYMRHLLTELLKHHLVAGHALLLSATLGAHAKTAFLGATGACHIMPSFQQAVSLTYPALTDAGGRRITLASGGANPKPVQVKCIPLFDRLESLLSTIADALAQGGRVLVVLNTVGRALTLQRAVEGEPAIPRTALFQCEGVISPHHGRYTPADRELLDAAVSQRLGKGSDAGPLLLTGTQTLEQSLDIDADLLITDLCPMDVLLQRIGRLHRHQRSRPEMMRSARCLLLVPESEDLENLLQQDGEATGSAKRNGIGSVYADLRTLQLTWDSLRKNPTIEIPRDNRLLVESATHPEVLEKLQGSRWQRHAELIEGGTIAQGIRAHQISLVKEYEKPFGSFSFSDLNEEARTRLGLGSLRLPLPETVPGPFGIPLTEVMIPGHMAPKSEAVEVTHLQSTDDGFHFRIGDRNYSYTRLGLEVLDESAD